MKSVGGIFILTSQFKVFKNQLSIEDFTDEQITSLFTLLAKKRQEQVNPSLKSKPDKDKKELDEQTKILLKKCTENRNSVFACPHCGSVSVVKNGFKDGRQRYKCKDCGKTFGDTHGTILYHSKLTAERWKDLLEHTMRNDSVRFIRKQNKMNVRTILYNRHRISELLKVLIENLDDFNSVVQADEYYIPLSFKDMKHPEYFIETLGRMPNTHITRKQRYDYVENAGYSKKTAIDLHKERKSEINRMKNFISKDDTTSSKKVSKGLN